MKKFKIIIPILIGIIIVLIGIMLFMNNKSENRLYKAQTQIVSDSIGSALQSEYYQTQERLDKLTSYVNSIQTDKFQEVKLGNVSNMFPMINCSFSSSQPLSYLNSGSDKFFYFIDKSKKFNAKLLGLNELNLGRDEKIGIMDYIEYKDTVCSDGGERNNVRLAAGVRLELRIKESNNKIKAETPSQIAAAMELHLAKVTYRIRTIGFKTDSTRKILSNIEEQGDFNVKSYLRLIDALNKIVASMNDNLQVNPEIVPYIN